MSPPTKIFLAVIGVGGVGQHFLSQLNHVTGKYPHLSLVFITRSSKSLFVEDFNHTLSLSNWASNLSDSVQPRLTQSELISYLSNAPGKCVVVDNTSDQDIADAYPRFLGKGISIVTPNKKAFSGNIGLWRDIVTAARSIKNPNGGLVYHESSVGAGLPIISTLKDLVETGDEITKIEGIFSGTMSYLCNNFHPFGVPVEKISEKWSDIVIEAKRQGYTEPDPRDDLNGMDVARKLVILARVAGVEVESIKVFPVQSLIPKELESVKSAEEFLAALPRFDNEMNNLRMKAEDEVGYTRYVGRIDFEKEKPELTVGLETVHESHAFANLTGSDNFIMFYTKRYGVNPLVVKGAGAGGAVTAMGVSADLIKVVERVSWT